jgi:hypothetical protein
VVHECNYPNSRRVRCGYDVNDKQKLCYFHTKVEAGLIDGYYENLVTSDDGRVQEHRWVVLS